MRNIFEKYYFMKKAILFFKKITEKLKYKNTRKIEIFFKYILPFLVIVIVIAANLLFGYTAYYIFSNKVKNYSDKIILRVTEAENYKEQLKEIKLEIFKAQKEKDTKDLIEFHELFTELQNDYLSDVNLFIEELNKEFSSLDDIKDDIKELTVKRMQAAENFKDKLMLMEV